MVAKNIFVANEKEGQKKGFLAAADAAEFNEKFPHYN